MPNKLTTIATALILTTALIGCSSSSTTTTSSTASSKVTPTERTITSFRAPYETLGSVERMSPAIDRIIPRDAKIEVLAEGFDWSEGPVWLPAQKALIFSDIPPNVIMKWKAGQGITTFMNPSGYSGTGSDRKEPGSNGLVLSPAGQLTLAEHGDRRIAQLTSLDQPNGEKTTLSSHYNGARLNSPNDLVYHRNGDIYFTDPPYGLAKNVNDPTKEIPFQGVYRIDRTGNTTLLHKDLERPNGIAFSPDYKTLYVANSHGANPIWRAFDVNKDGTLSNPRTFFDATQLKALKRPGGNDGMAVAKNGTLFFTGPGGVLVFSPNGNHLGTILTGQRTANCTFGDDGQTLYMTADMLLLRIKTNVTGMGF